MQTIYFDSKKTENPDSGGFNIKHGETFDVSDYLEAYNLNPADVDHISAKGCQDKASRLNPGEWLEVTHEIKGGMLIMNNEKQYAVCRTTGDVVYRIPGRTHGDGQQDDDRSPVWLLASNQDPDDYDALPRVTIEDA